MQEVWYVGGDGGGDAGDERPGGGRVARGDAGDEGGADAGDGSDGGGRDGAWR